MALSPGGNTCRRTLNCLTCVLVLVLASFAMRAPPSLATFRIASTPDPTGRIALGANHTCAIKNDNTVWCWGDNRLQQLGNTTFVSSLSRIPVLTESLPGSRYAVKISAGLNHTCLLANDGTVWCWGDNVFGQIGDSTTDFRAAPVQPSLGIDQTAADISLGGSTTCIILNSGEMRCWGKGTSGQLGNGSEMSSNSPVTVLGVPSNFSAAKLAVGSQHVCVADVQGLAWCWGSFLNGRLGTTATSNASMPIATASLGAAAVQVAAGLDHTCVLLATPAVSCFGKNNVGQIGQATTTASSSTPTVVTLVSASSKVIAGDSFTCSLSAGGVVECFGKNILKQLGDGGTASRYSSAVVSGMTGTMVDIEAGGAHACAVKATGELYCWGSNAFGQLALDPDTISMADPTLISGMNVVPTTTTTPSTIPISSSSSSTSSSSSIVATSVGSTTTSALEVITVPAKKEIDVVETITQTGTTTSSAVQNMNAPVKVASKVVQLITPLKLKRGGSVTASGIAAAVSMVIPKKSQGTMRISITSGSAVCRFSGTRLVGIKKGTCVVTVKMMPVRGKDTTRRGSVTVA